MEKNGLTSRPRYHTLWQKQFKCLQQKVVATKLNKGFNPRRYQPEISEAQIPTTVQKNGASAELMVNFTHCSFIFSYIHISFSIYLQLSVNLCFNVETLWY